jgi:hypothetical protein
MNTVQQMVLESQVVGWVEDTSSVSREAADGAVREYFNRVDKEADRTSKILACWMVQR